MTQTRLVERSFETWSREVQFESDSMRLSPPFVLHTLRSTNMGGELSMPSIKVLRWRRNWMVLLCLLRPRRFQEENEDAPKITDSGFASTLAGARRLIVITLGLYKPLRCALILQLLPSSSFEPKNRYWLVSPFLLRVMGEADHN